jgi:hypothetical protein
VDGVDERGSLWVGIAAGVVLTLAAALRFGAAGTTLFEDEVWVARLARGDAAYAPHTYSTPPLFHAINRAWVALRGSSDRALREPAAFFGVLLCAIPLFAPRPPLVRLLWSALLAFSSPLLFYSARLKQYTLEGCAAALLIVLYLRANDRKSWAIFFVVAIASVMTLFSPVFIVAALGLLSLRRPRLLIGFALVAAAWLVAWFAYLAPGTTTASLHGDMDVFFRAAGRWVDSPSSLMRNTLHWVGEAFNLTRFWWLVLAALAGWWAARTRDLRIILLAALPPLMVVAVSVAHRYPYGEVRLMIFCFPALFLLAAEALAFAARRVPLLLLLLAPFVLSGIVRDPYNESYMHLEDLRELIAVVQSAHRPGEPVYADPSYAAPLSYYLPTLGRDLHERVVDAPVGPGWYVQQRDRFRVPPGSVRMRTRWTVAARVP